MVYSTRRFVVRLSVCHFVLVFFSPFSIAITSLGEERANLSAFRTFVRFVLVWICRFPLPLEGLGRLRFVIVALPGLFSYLFFLRESTFQTEDSLYRVCNYRNAFFTSDDQKRIKRWSCQKVCDALSYLSDDIYVIFGTQPNC